MKEYLKIIDEIIALVGLHLIPKFVNLYQGQVDIRCEKYLSPPKLVGKDKKGSDK